MLTSKEIDEQLDATGFNKRDAIGFGCCSCLGVIWSCCGEQQRLHQAQDALPHGAAHAAVEQRRYVGHAIKIACRQEQIENANMLGCLLASRHALNLRF